MNFRVIELLSAYLDGQVSPSDSARLETRLKSDPEMGLALQSLRESRGLLRQLPHRRAPRNFTLTRQMVGLKPPLPRVYPVFRFATALAAILFVFSFTTNQVGQLAASAPVPALGLGGSGGGGPDLATEAPAAPSIESALMSTPTPEPYSLESTADAERAAQDSATTKNSADTAPALQRFSVPSMWLSIFAVVATLGALMLFAIPRLAARKWRAK